jgi:hypothetical protein
MVILPATRHSDDLNDTKSFSMMFGSEFSYRLHGCRISFDPMTVHLYTVTYLCYRERATNEASCQDREKRDEIEWR